MSKRKNNTLYTLVNAYYEHTWYDAVLILNSHEVFL